MTPDQIKAEIDLRLGEQLPSIAEKQAGWLSQKGRYFQLLPTHKTVPKDGEDTAPDNIDAKPHYQTATGRQMGGIPDLAMSSTRIDIYEGPKGKGYTISSTAKIGADLWERTINVGPETRFERGWEKVTQEII